MPHTPFWRVSGRPDSLSASILLDQLGLLCCDAVIGTLSNEERREAELRAIHRAETMKSHFAEKEGFFLFCLIFGG